MSPVKNVTWILIVISRHKSTEFGPDPHQIPWPFHVIYPGFICFPCWNMTWILDKFKSLTFHGICSENDGTSIGFGVIFETNQTAVNRTWEGPCNIFYREGSSLVDASKIQYSIRLNSIVTVLGLSLEIISIKSYSIYFTVVTRNLSLR